MKTEREHNALRYAVSGGIEIAEYLSFDAVIVGAGLAGLYTALHIDPCYSCCILTKERLDTSNSWLAQGGIAAAVAADDTPHFHLEDTLIAGAGLCDATAVSVLVDEGPGDIARLLDMQVPFDENELGDLLITREGGHRKRRVVHAGGDATGRETVKALSTLLTKRDSITIRQRAFLVDMLLDDTGAVCGALIHTEGAYRVIWTQHLLIATGGIGQLYQTSTNPSVATGDGIAAAMRAGAKLQGLEFVQFHPTGLYLPAQTGQTFLISEAVRGEGGILRNKDGAAFLEHVHTQKDLAPRDIVARAIVSEMQRTDAAHVYLDTRHLSAEFLMNRFPTIYQTCKRYGIDMSHDLIPVHPVQHYLIGGIATDLYARTNIPGLYAMGEAAHTGVHGANRLASNSMLECLVFGRRAAEVVCHGLRKNPQAAAQVFVPPIPPRAALGVKEDVVRQRVQTLMQIHGAVVRTDTGLRCALDELDKIYAQLAAGFTDSRLYIEILNIVTVARAILQGALAREISVGAHYREDTAV